MTKPETVACWNPKEICAQNRKSGLTKHTNLLGALRLGGVGHPVPHGRVDDLQPLSRQRPESLAVRHAPLSAPGIAVAPSPLCPGEAVAREYEQVLQPLVVLARCRHRGDRVPRLAVARRQAAVRSEPVVAGEVFDIDGDRKLGSGFGTYPRHSQGGIGRYRRPRGGGNFRRDSLDLRRVLGYPAREQLHRLALGGDDRCVRPGRGGRRADEGLDLFLDCFCRPSASPSLRSRRRNSSRPLQPPKPPVSQLSRTCPDEFVWDFDSRCSNEMRVLLKPQTERAINKCNNGCKYKLTIMYISLL